MLLTKNNSNTKLNKYIDVTNTKLSELVGLIEDFMSVNFFEIAYGGKIKNIIIQQIENKNLTIVIKIGYFQNNKKILCLIQHLSDEEIKKVLRLAIEKSFNCNLSNRKIIFVQEYPISTLHGE